MRISGVSLLLVWLLIGAIGTFHAIKSSELPYTYGEVALFTSFGAALGPVVPMLTLVRCSGNIINRCAINCKD